ncbi:MAG: hypothetical protein WCA38_03065 [Candidatus Acidiferrales bacterium]
MSELIAYALLCGTRTPFTGRYSGQSISLPQFEIEAVRQFLELHVERDTFDIDC